jgi:MFS family permease
MESFKRGLDFLKQSWQMALADRDLLKPSIYALFVGFAVSIVFIAPMALIGFVFGDAGIGQGLLFIFGTILVFAQYTVGYVFSAMTIYLIYGYLSEGDGRMDKARAIARRDFFDILTLAAASTAVNVLKSFVKGKGKSSARNFLSGLIDTVWTEATYLVLPAMVIEDIGLKDGLKRATDIVRRNLLLVGVSTVGVKAVTGLIGFLLGATGIALGLGVGIGLVGLSQGAPAGWVVGISLGVLIAAVFVLAATVIGSYTATAYHTCLYLWAREVEQVESSGGQAALVAPPGPLGAVLSKVQGLAPLSR